MLNFSIHCNVFYTKLYYDIFIFTYLIDELRVKIIHLCSFAHSMRLCLFKFLKDAPLQVGVHFLKNLWQRRVKNIMYLLKIVSPHFQSRAKYLKNQLQTPSSILCDQPSSSEANAGLHVKFCHIVSPHFQIFRQYLDPIP